MDLETIYTILILLFGVFYSRVMSSAECGETQYYDNETRACQECPKCRAGLELSSDCGWGDGEGGVCQPCESGTFQNGNDMYCSTCSYCKDRHVIQECSAKQDTKCGDCLPTFTFNMNLGMCQPCTTDCPTTKPTMTPSNTPTLQEPSPSVMSNDTNASSRFIQGNEHNTVLPRTSYSTWQTPSTPVMIGIVSVLMVALLGTMVAFVIVKRKGRTGQRNPSTNDLELQTMGINGTSDTSSNLLGTTRTNSVRSFVSGDIQFQNPANECGNPLLAEGGQDSNLQHASAIIRINDAIETKKINDLITYLYHGVDDFKQRNGEECSTFSEISKILEQLDQYSKERPCVLVLGLCTVGRKDLAKDLFQNTRCQKHTDAMCNG